MKNKKCLMCGKIMKFEDYRLYEGYPKHMFLKRKYCSKKCVLNSLKRKYKRKEWNLGLEHNQRILEANKIIKGKIVGINGGGKIKPDIIKDNIDYEVEILGSGAFLKFKKKYGKKISKKRNSLIICLRNGIYPLFDEINFMKDNGEIVSIK